MRPRTHRQSSRAHQVARPAPQRVGAAGRILAGSFSALMLTVSGIAPAFADTIHTAEAGSAYNQQLCPLLQAELGKAQLAYACTPSAGALQTLERIAMEPRHIGYVPLDVLALETERAQAKDGAKAKDRFVVVRSDDTRECLFLATRSKQFSAYGDIQAYADKLRFILPPKDSGAAATFAYLQKIDPEGLGRAKAVTYAESAEQAVAQALSAEDALALFVQVGDPAAAVFKSIDASGGQMIPVIDRAILRQQIAGQKIYFAQETEIGQAKWVKSGKKVVTACTPVAVITGDPARVADEKARQDHRDVIATIQKLKAEDLTPKRSFVQRMLKRSRELSALSVEKLLDVSEKARIASKPAMEKAKDATEKAYEKAKEATKEAMDKAREAMGRSEGGAGSGKGETPAPQSSPQPPIPGPAPRISG